VTPVPVPDGSTGPGLPSLRDAAVLVTTSCYAPECTGSAPYVTDLAESLAGRGARVRVVTAHPHRPGNRRPARTRNTWTREVRNGVDVRRVPTYLPERPGPARALLRELSFLPAAVREVRGPAPDVVVACLPSLSAAVLGAAVARWRKVPWLLLAHQDPAAGPEGHRARGLPAGPGRWVCTGAAHVVLPCPGLVPAVSALAPGCPVSVVPGWAGQELLAPADPRLEEECRSLWRERLDWRGRFVVAHTGDLGARQGLEELLPLLEGLLGSHPGVLFCLVGDGERRPALERAARRLPNLQVLAPVPDADYPKVLRAADVLLVHERAALPQDRAPRKLASYLAAGRPVLAVVRPDSPGARAVDRSGAGVVVPAGDAPALAAALTILRSDPVLRERLGLAGRAHCEEHLRPGAPLARLASLVAGVLTGEGDRTGPDGIRTIRLPDTQVLPECDRDRL